MIVQVVYEDGIVVESGKLPDGDAIDKSMNLLKDDCAEYERVRVLTDDGKIVFDQRVNR